MNIYRPSYRAKVGHGVFSSAKRLADGSDGFGFVANSTLAKRYVAENYGGLAILHRHPASDGLGGYMSGDWDGYLPIRTMLDEKVALGAFFTAQGEDENGRTGRYACEFFVGSAKAIPLSWVLRINRQLLIAPSSLSVEGGDQLHDVSPEDFLVDSIDREEVSPPLDLIDRIKKNNWTSVTISARDLGSINQLLQILHPGWDRVAQLQPDTRSGTIRWTLSLPEVIPDWITTDIDNGQVSIVDNVEWNALKEKYGSAKSRRDLISAENASRELSIPELVDRYVDGQPEDLSRLLEAQEDAAIQRVAEQVLNIFLERRVPFIAGPGYLGANSTLLRVADVSWGTRNSIRSLIPDELGEQASLAEAFLTWDLLDSIIDGCVGARQYRNIPALKLDDCSPAVLLGVRRLWISDSERRSVLVDLLRRSGTATKSLIRALIELASSSDELTFVFERLLPETFEEREIYRLVQSFPDQFRAWLGIPDVYWEILKLHTPQTYILKRLLNRR